MRTSPGPINRNITPTITERNSHHNAITILENKLPTTGQTNPNLLHSNDFDREEFHLPIEIQIKKNPKRVAPRHRGLAHHTSPDPTFKISPPKRVSIYSDATLEITPRIKPIEFSFLTRPND